MQKITCLIIDDEELARDLLENFVNKLPHLELIAKCENPLIALEKMQETKIDLLFLDIQMPELTGVEFLKSLHQKPTVIFTTAYPSYALEGYQLDVIDYLLKPFSFERFAQAVNKASDYINLKDKASSSNTTPSLSKDYILVNADHKVHKIRYSDLIYIESMREYVAYHTPNGRILSLMSLKQLEKDLPSHRFLRIHKSYIINIEKVTTLEGNMVHINDKKLPIGASYKEVALERIF